MGRLVDVHVGMHVSLVCHGHVLAPSNVVVLVDGVEGRDLQSTLFLVLLVRCFSLIRSSWWWCRCRPSVTGIHGW